MELAKHAHNLFLGVNVEFLFSDKEKNILIKTNISNTAFKLMLLCSRDMSVLEKYHRQTKFLIG